MAFPTAQIRFPTYTPSPPPNLHDCIISSNSPFPPPSLKNCIISSNVKGDPEKCLRACQNLSNNMHHSFEDLLENLPKLMDEPKIEIRNPDSPTVSISLKGQFLPLTHYLDQFEQNEASLKWELYSDVQEGFRDCYRVGKTDQNESIQLSHITSIFRNNNPEGSYPATIAHPTGDNYRKALGHCKHLFVTICNSQLSEFDTNRQIYRLHWWLAQTSPYIAPKPYPKSPVVLDNKNDLFIEIFIAAVKFHKFGILTPYVENSYPHQLALVTSEDNFLDLARALRN